MWISKFYYQLYLKRGTKVMIKKIALYLYIILISAFCALGYFGYISLNYGFDLKGGTELMVSVNSTSYIKEKLSKLTNRLKTISSDAIIQDTTIIFSSNENEDTVKNFLSNLNLLIYQKKDNLYYAHLNNIDDIEKNLISSSIDTIKSRIDPLGTKDISITQSGKNNLLISIPGEINLDHIEKILSQKAFLAFHFVVGEDDENAIKVFYKDSQKYEYVSEFPYITGSNLTHASPTIDLKSQNIISIRLDAAGTKTFSFMTKEKGRRIAIILDNEILTAPNVEDKILSGQASITGFKFIEEASNVALLLKSGSLKADFKIVQKFKVGPTIGEEAIKNSIPTIAKSIASVGALMIGCYGFYFGIISIFTILSTLILIVILMYTFSITLTLFGIGGIIATIGMCVDSNVLIFENIIHERKHNTINYIEKGFANAWITIFDSNITTIMSAIGLMIFGSTMLIGFAITLIIGILASIISAVYIAKELMVK